jgi:hypothetical protein
VRDAEGATELAVSLGPRGGLPVSLRDVSFGYTPDRPILNGLSLDVSASPSPHAQGVGWQRTLVGTAGGRPGTQHALPRLPGRSAEVCLESRHLESRPKAEARLDLEVSLGCLRHLCLVHTLLTVMWGCGGAGAGGAECGAGGHVGQWQVHHPQVVVSLLRHG